MLDSLLFLVIGVLLVVFGAISLGRPERLNLFLLSSVTSPPRTFLNGVAVEIIGLLLLLNFGVFADGLMFTMSLIGWLATVKGILMILAPRRFAYLVQKLADDGVVLLIAPIIALSLGFFMTVTACFL